jgi:hypothetical protein
MYGVAMPLSDAVGLHPQNELQTGVPTVDLVPGFDTRGRHHGTRELQVRVGRFVQFLRHAHLRAGECGALDVDHPVVEPRRRRPWLEERPQHQVRRREFEHRRDAERALAGSGRRHRGPALPGAENGALVSVQGGCCQCTGGGGGREKRGGVSEQEAEAHAAW